VSSKYLDDGLLCFLEKNTIVANFTTCQFVASIEELGKSLSFYVISGAAFFIPKLQDPPDLTQQV
jgi:hypothetical protein